MNGYICEKSSLEYRKWKEMESKIISQHNFIFWFHLVISLIGPFAPFLVSWYLIIPVYAGIYVQFLFFNRCLMNEKHSLSDGTENTIFSYFFEMLGWHHNKARVTFFVRKLMYPILILITIIWQLLLDKSPLLF
ncbi:MAG: hypothetical protein IPI60_08030 [Saprospiraceae bacterium]|nr:hypothetical protein [Saprospiraceae bacterium]